MPLPAAAPPEERASARKHPGWYLRRALPAALVVLYGLQCAWFIRTQSLTYDEPVHIAEGLDSWRHGRFEQYNDHPPLARLWCALPLINDKWQIEIEPRAHDFRVSRISPDPEALAWRARAMNVLLGVALALLLWRVADRLFSRGAANFALALFAFAPSLIAHFSLATTDGAAALLIFATAWQLVRWRRNPTWHETFLLGAALGLLLLAKFSTAPMFVLALLWSLVPTPEDLVANPLRWNWRKAGTTLLLALITVWAGYFFHISRLTVGDGTLTATFPNWSQPLVRPVRTRVNYSVLVPAGEYLEGFRNLARHNAHGQPAFFLGQVSTSGGWKLYYPVAILLKWPALLLLTCLTGLLLGLWRFRRVALELWIMASFPAAYFLFAIFAKFNIGERHILPLYPFALLFAAFLWEQAKPRRAGMAVLALLAMLNAADALRSAPDYLAYFNLMVPPGNGVYLLTDSNLDWGQGLLAMRKYEREHPEEKIRLAYFGSVAPAVYGIKAQPLAENERATGTLIVGATNVSGQFLDNWSSYRWLLPYPHTRILDSSLYVFKVPEN